MADKNKKEGMEVLNGVPREQANVEIEKGEVVLGTDVSSNQKITAVAGGEKHGSGGTPENLPDGSAVFSDRLQLKDPTLLKILGFNGKKPKTFAQIAKKWDTSKLIKKKEDESIDKITEDSLDRSLENANFKLSLAFTLQQFHEKKNGSQKEHSKHFEPLMERTGLSYEELFDSAEESTLDDKPEQPPMDMGGQISFNPIPEMPHGGEKDPPTAYEEATEEGRTTPTGKLNYYSARQEDLGIYTNRWKTLLNVDKFTSNEDFQRREYEWALKNNPEAIKNMWLTYGLTAKGMTNPALRALTQNGTGKFTRSQLNDPEVLKKLEDAFVDGHFGVRQLDPNAPELDDKTVVQMINPDKMGMDLPHKWNLNHIPDQGPEQDDMRFRWENRRALAQARKQRANIPYLRPLMSVSDTFYADQAYYNPDQAIAGIQSLSGAQDKARGMFQAPQQQLANQVAGQQFSMLTGVISDYADKNVNAYNREQLTNTNIAQRAADKLAAAIQGHHAGITTLKQNFANAFQRADNQVADLEIAMHKERADRRNLEESIGEQYRIDPNTGRKVFVQGKDFYPDTTPEKTVDERFAEIKRKHPSISDDAAVKLAMAEFSGKYDVKKLDNQPYNEDDYRS